MKPLLSAFAGACGGVLEGADGAFAGVSTDTRTLKAGEIYVALKGERFDGHGFVAAARAAGAAAAVVAVRQGVALPQIVAPDPLVALQRAANAWREGFGLPLVGVAGSNGKTTVKELTAAILREVGECLATRGNLNNHIGVPLTLLRLGAQHRFAVVEMGADRAGEVEALVRIARPTVGLITNAGAEHLEGFGSLDGVARAEGEMVAGLAPDATAVINADDAYAPLWRSMTRAHVVSFGLDMGADFTAADLHAGLTEEGFLTRFRLRCPLGEVPIELRLAGRHNVLNALCAAAAAAAAGAGLDAIRGGLAAMQPVQGRLQCKRAAAGALIIDDSYNANPSSVKAGIEVLEQAEGRRWLVFADMAELGAYAEDSHREIGAFARAHGIERLFATGTLAARAAESFGPGAEWHSDVAALTTAVQSAVAGAGAGAAVRMLVKGSRFNRLERLVAALCQPADPAGLAVASPAAPGPGGTSAPGTPGTGK
ncbi:MAG TPA: UDP-N-acetylmuramoyl-tripeptide--D-alanyl-D-alanine ligase [Steroidobacteraceae bacterium]|nr:UDP-N-acetylmuramoyl-tripeptide--D-alanyl-D-alanine ligase [Steroidobacteraceae bacterium]